MWSEEKIIRRYFNGDYERPGKGGIVEALEGEFEGRGLLMEKKERKES